MIIILSCITTPLVSVFLCRVDIESKFNLREIVQASGISLFHSIKLNLWYGVSTLSLQSKVDILCLRKWKNCNLCAAESLSIKNMPSHWKRFFFLIWQVELQRCYSYFWLFLIWVTWFVQCLPTFYFIVNNFISM